MTALIISFLFDCFANEFFRSLGSILGYCEYLLALLSALLGDYLNIVFLFLLFVLVSEVTVFGV